MRGAALAGDWTCCEVACEGALASASCLDQDAIGLGASFLGSPSTGRKVAGVIST